MQVVRDCIEFSWPKHTRSTRCVRCTSAKCVVYSHLATHAVKCTLFLYSYIYIFLLTRWRCRNRVLMVDVCTTCIYHNKVKPKANGKQTLSSSEHRLNTTVLDTREYSISPAPRTSFTITTIPYLLYHSRLYMLVKSCFVIIMFLFAIGNSLASSTTRAAGRRTARAYGCLRFM